MKTYFAYRFGLKYGLVLMLLFTSCHLDEFNNIVITKGDPEITSNAEASDPTRGINSSFIIPKTARLFGKHTEDWTIHFAKELSELNCNNIDDAQLLKLTERVVAPLFNLEDATFDYTITKDQFVLLPTTLIFIYHGCPAEYEFGPAEGQSIEDWMNEFAISVIDGVEKLEIYFDGIKVEAIENYRTNTGEFSFTANPDLTTCHDPCFTGEPQPGLVDGYLFMFKKMKIGKHTLLVKGALPAFDLAYEITINLNVIK